MAIEVGRGEVPIDADFTGFDRDVSRHMRGAGEKAGKDFADRFLPGIKALGIAAGTALVAGAGIAGAFGIRAAADFQQTTIAFEGILGSGEKAKAMLDDLRKFAERTPFEFPGLATAAKQLLAVGFGAEDVIPTMTTLGNVAATLGVGEAEIQGVVRALGQMKGKGKASAEELQQISEQVPGFSAVKAIAEDMGVTVAEAFKLLEKGAIPADRAIEAILNGMEKFPGAAGAMDRQSKTLNGVISTFKDTLTGVAIDFITPYLPGMSAAVTRLSGLLTGTFIPALHTIVDVATQVFNVLVKGDFTGGPFEEDSSFILGLFTARETFESMVDTVRTRVLPILGNLVDYARDDLVPILAAIGGFITDTVVPALFDLGSKLLTVSGWITEHKPALVALSVFVGGVLAGAFIAWTVGVVANTVALVANGLATVASNLKLVALTAVIIGHGIVVAAATIAVGALTAAQWLLNLAASANPFVAVALALAGLVAGVIWAYQNVDAFRGFIDRLWQIMQSTFRWVVDNWPLLLAIITGPFGLAALAISRNWDSIKDGFTAVKNWIGDRIEDIVGFFTRLPGRITDAASSMWDGFKDLAREAVEWVGDKLDTLLGPLDEIAGKIAGLARGLTGSVDDVIARETAKAKGRAFGGPVTAGKPYVVGELGHPELFVPHTSGTIVPSFGGMNVTLRIDGNVYGVDDLERRFDVFSAELERQIGAH
ncbi:MAG: tape measure protein [Acidimicrobiia bacterium]